MDAETAPGFEEMRPHAISALPVVADWNAALQPAGCGRPGTNDDIAGVSVFMPAPGWNCDRRHDFPHDIKADERIAL